MRKSIGEVSIDSAVRQANMETQYLINLAERKCILAC